MRSEIFFIGAAGFIFLAVYNFRTKRTYVETNSNKFLIFVFVWGMLPFSLATLIRELAKTCPQILHFFQVWENLIFVADIALYSLCSSLLGFLLSSHCVQTRWQSIRQWLGKTENHPHTKGIVGRDLYKFSIKGELLIFTLKNSKVYVGFLLFADYIDDLSPEQKSIRILPFKSGIRKPDGTVEYKTYYFPIDEENVEYNDKFMEQLENIQELVIFQREIISYTVYSKELNSYFQHDNF